MAEKCVHYLAQSKIRARLARTEEEIEKVSVQLQEALKMGDLSENAEYDAAKDAMARATRERDMLKPVLSMPTIKASDSVSLFEEGCVVDLKVYGTTEEPMDTNSSEFKERVAQIPVFSGIVMLGGALPIQELLLDAALDAETPVGKFLIGKPSGFYSIKVPGGFSIVEAKKLKSTEFTPEQIGCTYHGE